MDARAERDVDSGGVDVQVAPEGDGSPLSTAIDDPEASVTVLLPDEEVLASLGPQIAEGTLTVDQAQVSPPCACALVACAGFKAISVSVWVLFTQLAPARFCYWEDSSLVAKGGISSQIAITIRFTCIPSPSQ